MDEDPIRLRLDFHQESVLLHDYAKGVVRTRFVSALDVAHALACELDLPTGLLPPDTLWWSRTASGTRLALWRETRVWITHLRTSYDTRPRRLCLPMPGLVFICMPAGCSQGRAPYLFAAKERPRSPNDTLYHAPAYNVFDSGRVCPGTHAFPNDPARVPEEFFHSFFSASLDTARGKSQRYPDDIGQLWNDLHGKAAYPLDDLVPQLRVADALRIGE